MNVLCKDKGRTGAVVSVADYEPRGPSFETRSGRRSLWPWSSHIYPLLSTGLTQEPVDVRLTWTDHDEVGDYVVPNVVSPRDLHVVFRPDNMDETVIHTQR